MNYVVYIDSHNNSGFIPTEDGLTGYITYRCKAFDTMTEAESVAASYLSEMGDSARAFVLRVDMELKLQTSVVRVESHESSLDPRR